MQPDAPTAAALRAQLAYLNIQIAYQGAALLEAHLAPRLGRLRAHFASFGIEVTPHVRYETMGEDTSHGLLPPRVLGQLFLSRDDEELSGHAVEVEVGEFHEPHKPERLFEMCMLRSEVEAELVGGGDGHVRERVEELAREMNALGIAPPHL